jgi:hypothetical protein
MDKLEIGAGIIGILTSLLVKDFRPSGWTTHLMWGGGEDARIPRWVAASFYFILGVVLIYHGSKR